jgi:hypothetical protein
MPSTPSANTGTHASVYDDEEVDGVTLGQIKEDFDKDFTNNQTSRVKAADCLLFANVTQWDSSYLDSSQLAYKGQFDVLRKARRQIMADLRSNPVQISFEPKAGARDDGADLLDGMYLTDDRRNSTIEAYENAVQEAVDCGLGGWERYTMYESRKNGDRHQVICARPIYEFNNNAFPDSNARLMDKSDAKRWTILEPYTEQGYSDVYLELTGDERDPEVRKEAKNPSNFGSPEQSYVFPWVTNDVYYIARHYRKRKIKDAVVTFSDPFGQMTRLLESQLKEYEDSLIDMGYRRITSKEIERWEVRLYICSGERILKSYEIPGEHIPVVPIYGERAFVEAEECWEGITYRAMDPQRLRNFMLSYLADMVSRSPRPKPIFSAEQIAGFEQMYELNGADNNYPYLLQKLKDQQGNDLPRGPLATLEAPQIGPAMATLIELSRQSVEDVANPGLPKEYGDKDLSGKAVELMQQRFDQQSIIYQQNMKHAKRYDADVYASMATEVFDAPREVTLTLPDGTRKTEQIMLQVVDEKTGELKTINDLTNQEFEVYAEVGPSYTSMRDKTIDQVTEIADITRETDPVLHKGSILTRITLTPGPGLEPMRDYARKQLLFMGWREPEDEEEAALLEQQQQQQEQPDPNMLLAQGEYMKGQAAVMKEQRETQNDQVDQAINVKKVSIQEFDAETKRQDTRIRAAQAGVQMRLAESKIKNERFGNIIKMRDARSRLGTRVNA